MHKQIYHPFYYPDKLHIDTFRENHSVPEEFAPLFRQFLMKNENKIEILDLGLSRKSKNYFVIKTSFTLKSIVVENIYNIPDEEQEREGRYIFFKIFHNDLILISDAESLVKSYESKDQEFKILAEKDPIIYLFVAISYCQTHSNSNELENDILAVKKFIKNCSSAKGESLENSIEDYAFLFKAPAYAFVMFHDCYLDLGMLKEASITIKILVDCFMANENNRIEWYGYSKLLLEKYEEAMNYLNESTKHEYHNFFKASYYWVLGLEKWKKNEKNIAEEALQNARKSFCKGSPEKKLMNYLIKYLLSENNIPPMNFQISLLLKWRKKEFENKEIREKQKKQNEIVNNTQTKLAKDIKYIRDELVSFTKQHDNSDIKSKFISEYKVVIKPGPKRKGFLVINGKSIQVSPRESDILTVLCNKLHEDWRYYLGQKIIDFFDIGWVSYEDLTENVVGWRKDTSDTTIINAIYILNKKIRGDINLITVKEDFIENGASSGRAKYYRLRIYPPFIDLE